MIFSEANNTGPPASRWQAAYGVAKPKESPAADGLASFQPGSAAAPPNKVAPNDQSLRSSDRDRRAETVSNQANEFDPKAEREAQANRMAEMAASLEQALKRITRFFRPEDLRDPPGPIEIQRRVVDANNPLPNDPTARAVAEQNRNPKPNLRDDIEKQSESPLDVVV